MLCRSMRYGHCHRVLDFLLDPLFLLYIPWIDNRYLIEEFPGNAIVLPPLTSCTSGPRVSVVSRCVDLRNQNHNCPLMSFISVASSPLMLLPNHRSPRRYIPLPSSIPDPPSLSRELTASRSFFCFRLRSIISFHSISSAHLSFHLSSLSIPLSSGPRS